LAALVLESFRNTTVTPVTTDYCKSSQRILPELVVMFSISNSTLTELKSSPSRIHSESHSLPSSKATKVTKMHTHTHIHTHTHTGALLTELIISSHVRILFYTCNTFSVYTRKRPCFLHPCSRKYSWKTEFICHTNRRKKIY
jgi:hypothetical protein